MDQQDIILFMQEAGRIYLANIYFLIVLRKRITVYSKDEAIHVHFARKKINHNNSNAKSLLWHNVNDRSEFEVRKSN